MKIDFSAIANEKITLFHDSKNQSLHIIFADGSQDIIEPFFDLRGIMSNLLLDMGSGQEFNGERFASQFPITEDQSVLPAAGPGGVASGADFHGPFVDGLFTGNPLDLLPPEELPGLQFTITATPLLTEDFFVPFTFGNLNGLVEEEELRFQVQQEERPVKNVANGDGNEDNNDKSNNDADNLADRQHNEHHHRGLLHDRARWCWRPVDVERECRGEWTCGLRRRRRYADHLDRRKGRV